MDSILNLVLNNLSRYRHADDKGRGSIALLFLDLGTRWGESSGSRHGRTLPPGKGPPVPIGWVMEWPMVRYCYVSLWLEVFKKTTKTEIRSRSFPNTKRE
jgi:hypothetical protein